MLGGPAARKRALLLGFFLPTMVPMTSVEVARESATAARVWDIATKLLVPLSIGLAVAILSHEIQLGEQKIRLERLEIDLTKQEAKLDQILRGLGDVSNKITRLETILDKK